jgi:hypothetical protein
VLLVGLVAVAMFIAGVAFGDAVVRYFTGSVDVDPAEPPVSSPATASEWQLIDMPADGPYSHHCAVGRDFYFIGTPREVTVVTQHDTQDGGTEVTYTSSYLAPLSRFDTLTGTWMMLEFMPHPPSYGVANCVAWGEDSLVVTLQPVNWTGTDQPLSVVQVYDVNTDTWTLTPPVPIPPQPERFSYANSRVLPNGDSLYYVYSFGLAGSEDIGIWRYERTTGTWDAPYRGPDAMFADAHEDALVSRDSGFLGDRLVVISFASWLPSSAEPVVVGGAEVANPQTGLLERFNLSDIPMTGRSGAPNPDSCYMFYGGSENLWLCMIYPGMPFYSLDVFDFVAGEFVYLGHFEDTSACDNLICGQQAVPGGQILVGMDVINPYSQVRTRIPDLPNELWNITSVAFSSTMVLACTQSQCARYSFA